MTITVELTVEQLLSAIHQLPFEERIKLLQTLIQEDKEEINRRFDNALANVHAANSGLNEEDVMAEVNAIVHQVRTERNVENRR